MRKPVLLCFAAGLFLSPFAALSAEGDEGAPTDERNEMTREQRHAAWESLSEEEKQAKREEWQTRREQRRAEWEAMTPEEREAKRAEMRAKWEAMTPEQREKVKERRKHRRHHRVKPDAKPEPGE